MKKEEIKHFKAMLRQGSLRHMNILLDDKFQKELLNIIKDYEKLQQENKDLHNKIDKAIEYMKDFIFEPLAVYEDRKLIMFNENLRNFEKILKDSDVDEC